MPDYQVFELGDVALQSGLTLRAARLANQTYGSPNARKDNVIVFPAFFSSQHEANEPMIGPSMAPDPERDFILVRNLFGKAFPRLPVILSRPMTGPDFLPLVTTTISTASTVC